MSWERTERESGPSQALLHFALWLYKWEEKPLEILKRQVTWSGSYFKQVTQMAVSRLTGRDKDRSQEGSLEALCKNLGQR